MNTCVVRLFGTAKAKVTVPRVLESRRGSSGIVRSRQAFEDVTKHLLLDMSELEVLSSAGLRAIQNIFKLFTPQDDVDVMREHGDEPYKSPYFKIVCAKPEIYYILNITGFLQNILIYNNLVDATNSFGGE
jgi:anti-anti-sigma regulatory factor